MLFTVCGTIMGHVFANVEADSIEEAIEIVQNDDDLDWNNEQWMADPIPISIRDNEANKVRYL